MSAATSRTCDGCGRPGGDPLPQAPSLDYCAECMPVVRDFLRDVDQMHSNLATEWKQGLEKIREKYAAVKELPY